MRAREAIGGRLRAVGTLALLSALLIDCGPIVVEPGGPVRCRIIELQPEYSVEPIPQGPLVPESHAASASFFEAISVTVPSAIAVTEGSAIGAKLLLTYRAAEVESHCIYEGQQNPDVLRFVSCDSGVVAGQSVVSDAMRAEFIVANPQYSITTARLRIEQASRCDLQRWVRSSSHFDEHKPGLDETVAYVTDLDKFVVRADGRIQSPRDFGIEEDIALRRRIGTLTPESLTNLARANDQTVLPVTVQFNLSVDWTDLTARLAGDAATRLQAEGELASAIAQACGDARAQLEAAGLRSLVCAEHEALVYGEGTRAAIRAASRLSLTSVVHVDVPTTLRLTFARNVTTDPKIDQSFNAAGLFGAGLNLGINESKLGCPVYGKHTSFAFSALTENEAPRYPCNNDLECYERCVYDPANDRDGRELFCKENVAAGGKFCHHMHVTATASAAAAAVPGEPWSAAKAHLFNFLGTSCNESAFSRGYDWFVRNNVRTVFESIACDQIVGSSANRFVQDVYARDHGVFVARAADNFDAAPACWDTMNATCVGANSEDGKRWDETGTLAKYGSSYINPKGDREEPDVMALGNRARVARLVTPDNPLKFDNLSGTSLSAPIAAASALLLKEACGDAHLDQRWTRSVMMTSAWSRNPEGWRYSTPLAPYDHTDGAGILAADNLMSYCRGGNGSPATASGQVLVDLRNTPRIPTLRVAKAAPPPGDPAGGGGSSGTPKSLDPSAWQGTPFWSATLTRGTRVRTTWSWDACPSSTGSRVAVDFDVLLCKASRCIYASRSHANNNEGFDVVVDDDGVWTLWEIHPAPKAFGKYLFTFGCRGSAVEPAAWSVVWGSF